MRTNAETVPQSNLLTEVSDQLAAMREVALEQGQQLQPPILALGISERVGSNWFLDTLADTMPTHNEPFRQQLHGSHPFSTTSTRPELPSAYPLNQAHPYEKYWLTNFVTSKYGPAPQIIKETNLFFATENLLELFPESPVVLLARNPVGIASSFAGGDLFNKWNYAERYNQLKSMTREPRYEQYQFVFDGAHDPGSLRKLTRLIVLNTLLVSSALTERESFKLSYESSVLDRANTLGGLAAYLNLDVADLGGAEAEVSAGDMTDHTFSTRKKKTELTARLDPEDVKKIQDEVRRLLADSLTVLSEPEYLDAQALLELHAGQYKALGRKAVRASAETGKSQAVDGQVAARPEQAYVQVGEAEQRWANQPVTNGDFIGFLNAMHNEGIPNVIHGTQLFVNEDMIPDRGGRIWFNSNRGNYEVTEGYENHPVYWVTWLGAAAYARYNGERLPDRAELDELVKQAGDIDLTQTNSGHKNGDVHAAGITPPNEQGIYDLVGNVASWCRDGYTAVSGQGANRYMFGTAWNRNATMEEVTKIKSRPLTGCSRSVGIRLLADENQKLTPSELAQRFEGWFDILSRPVDVTRTDRYIIDQLTR